MSNAYAKSLETSLAALREAVINNESEIEYLKQLCIGLYNNIKNKDHNLDYACVECVPFSNGIIKDFRCYFHRAASLAERETGWAGNLRKWK